MKVSIIGSGPIGRATGIGLQQPGHQVIFYDVDSGTLERLATEYDLVQNTIVVGGYISETDMPNYFFATDAVIISYR